ncbi:MAG: phosphoribosylformylglycinamidine cyclo-ligase [Xanthomonadaceae bacterium]|nr:phosphoribosylformylglycinamidine cyclo-ligase [Xanthomonadaceae bacterium]
MSYREAGVDIEKGDAFVESIKGLVKSTLNKNVRSSVGGYASLYALGPKQFIAASTDGVGTKLKLAFELKKHDTVGIDLVAMSVNDLICVGATPLFFLDYLATGKLDPAAHVEVIRGITDGCKQAECALVGGETAEMPGFYQAGEYDLAGFAVGLVNAKDVLPSKKIKPGLTLIGIASSGFHSNGYSLVRKILSDTSAMGYQGSRALVPTRIYVKSVLPLIQKGLVLGAAHITGSGFLNIPRISTNVSYDIAMPSLNERAEIFTWATRVKKMEMSEWYQTFNMGIGMVLAVESKNAEKVLKALTVRKEKAWIIGKTIKKTGKQSQIKILDRDQGSCTLNY